RPGSDTLLGVPTETRRSPTKVYDRTWVPVPTFTTLPDHFMYRLTTLIAACFVIAAPLSAQSSTTLQIHGFADWGTGHSNGGTYEFGSQGRTMSAGMFAI